MSASSFLVVQARSALAAIPVAHATLVHRPLPVEPLAGAPPFVRGVALVRGAPVPVVDLGALLGLAGEPRTTRFAGVRTGERRVALAVEGVLGVRSLDLASLEALPPLLGEGGAALTLGALDRGLVLVLETARLVPESTWARITAGGVA